MPWSTINSNTINWVRTLAQKSKYNSNSFLTRVKFSIQNRKENSLLISKSFPKLSVNTILLFFLNSLNFYIFYPLGSFLSIILYKSMQYLFLLLIWLIQVKILSTYQDTLISTRWQLVCYWFVIMNIKIKSGRSKTATIQFPQMSMLGFMLRHKVYCFIFPNNTDHKYSLTRLPI